MSGISHNQAIQLIDRRLDGLLNEKQLLALDEHLRSCDECNMYASEMELLPLHLRHEFHTRWDHKPGPSQNIIEYVTTKAGNIPTANRFSSGMTLFAGAMMLIVLGITINFVISRWRGISPAALATEPVNNPPLNKSGLVAFVSEQNGNFDIYTMRADGRALINVTNNPGSDTSPFWSPDGKRIAFESDRDGFTQIYLMNADGASLLQLTKDKAHHGLPVDFDNKTNPWSPDGSKLLFLQQETGDEASRLYSMEIDSGNRTMLASGNIQSNNISWSPDGNYIGYVNNDSPTPRDTFDPDIYVVEPDGSNPRELKTLISQEERLNIPYYWSRAGHSIFFITQRHMDEGKDQWIAYEGNLDENKLTQKATSSTPMTDWWEGTSFVTGFGVDSPFTRLRSDGTFSTFKPFEPCKTPDGVQYLNRRSSNGDLVMGVGCPNHEWWFYWSNPDGTVIKQLLNSPIRGVIHELGNIAWSSDDHYIAFTLASEKTTLYILNIEEALKDPSLQPEQVIIGRGDLYASPAWQPNP